MQIQTHPLISPALGTERQLQSFHYGPAGAQKIYVQSSLHADELPGMLVSWALRRKLAALEAAGKLRGEIVVVPVPNPIGLNQHLLGQHIGRFETYSASNFNRGFHDLAALVGVFGEQSFDSQHAVLAIPSRRTSCPATARPSP